MFVERKSITARPIQDIFAGETFEYDGHIFIKTNKKEGCAAFTVDLGSGEWLKFHESLVVNFVKTSKVVIE